MLKEEGEELCREIGIFFGEVDVVRLVYDDRFRFCAAAVNFVNFRDAVEGGE